MVSMGWDDIEL